MIDTLVVLAVGAAGGILGARLRIPGGSLIGAMAAVGAVQILSAAQLAIAPYWATLGQILVGAVIGSSIDRRMIMEFRRVLGPGTMAVATMVGGGLLIGIGFTVLGFADPLTSLFGLAPGGFAEMTAAAVALGANGPLVATIHLVRVIAVLVLLPVLLGSITRSAGVRELEARRRQSGGDLE
jgi:membrane AbrB-like protein